MIYDSKMDGFKGVYTRQCSGTPTHTYKYGNDCVVEVYNRAVVLKQPSGYMLIYTGDSRQTAFVEAQHYKDPKQQTLTNLLFNRE